MIKFRVRLTVKQIGVGTYPEVKSLHIEEPFTKKHIVFGIRCRRHSFRKENNVSVVCMEFSVFFYLFVQTVCCKKALSTRILHTWSMNSTRPREKLHKHEQRCRIVESSCFTYIMAVPTKQASNTTETQLEQRVKLSWYFMKNFDGISLGLFTKSQSWRV